MNAEDETLFLPLDIDVSLHVDLGLSEAASAERKLREGKANDAVGALCDAILHTMVLIDSKNTHSRGVYQNTRALKYINQTKERKWQWIHRYHGARKHLIALTGSDPKTLKDYPELLEEHVTTETIDLGQKTLSIVREVGSVSYHNKQSAPCEVLSEL